MNTYVTRAAILAGYVLIATPLLADDLTPRGDVTVGIQLYRPEGPFERDDTASFFDKYRYLKNKGTDLPFFVDLTHLDLGLVRDDGTYAVRLQRWSPGWSNDRAELEGGWPGVSLLADYRRYRSDELRLFSSPTGVGSAFASVFNDDTSADDRFFVRRTSAGLAVRVRPAGFDHPSDLLKELEFSSRYEHRSGQRQDRYVLSGSQERGAGGLNTSRFRAFTRDIDQDVTSIGTRIVSTPWDLLTSAIELEFESFRERAPTTTLGAGEPGSISAFDPVGILAGFQDPLKSLRAFNYVPDTDRLYASLRVRPHLGPVQFHGGASVTRLKQAGSRAPEQIAFGLDDNSVTTYSIYGAGEFPLTDQLALNGYAKFWKRRNALDSGNILFSKDQTDAFLEQLREVKNGLELRATPMAGTDLTLGYRGRFVRRDLEFQKSTRSVAPEFTIIGEDTTIHTGYLGWNLRLVRSLQLSGEAGYENGTEIGYPRELERAYYAKARVSYVLPRPVPMTLTASGRFLDGESDEIELLGESAGARRKQFEVRRWNYDVTLTAVPKESLVVFGSFTQHRNEERFAHLRSNIRRFEGPVPASILNFFIDSVPQYESDVLSVTLGGSYQISKTLEASLATTVTRTRVDIAGGGGAARALDEVNQIRNQITSIECGLSYRATRQVRLDLGYRFDRFHDDVRLEALDFSTREHTLSVSVTMDLDALTP